MQPHTGDLKEQRRAGAAPYLLPFAVLAAVFFVLVSADAFGTLNSALMDTRFRVLDRTPSDTLVIVEIDPKSLQEEEHWPWSRDRYATAIIKLQEAGASLIGFDVDFSSRSDESGDEEFATALSRRPGEVILPVFWQWSSRSATGGEMIKTPPNAKFLNDAIVASVTLTSERNGVVRRGWRGVNDGDVYRASIATVLASAPGDRTETFLIDYSINPDRISRLSFHDVISGNFPPEAVRGKNILIGATALELGDEFATPVWGVLPGVVIHALSYESMVNGRALMRPHPAISSGIGIVLLLWLAGASKNWKWLRFGVSHLGIFIVTIAAPMFIQIFLPVSFDVGAILGAQLLGLIYVVGVRLHRYASQIIRQRAATAHYQGLTSLVVKDNADGVIVTDNCGRIELCNDRARALLGADLAVGKLISAGVADFPLLGGDAFQSNLGESVSVAAPTLSELIVPGGDGLTLEIIGTVSSTAQDGPRVDATHTTETYVYTLRDISARKRIEQAEREAKEAAIAANLVKTQLISNMSHELRTPLNGVIGFADILQKEAYGPLGVPEYRDFAENIYVSGRRLLGVFNDMLHIAKLDAGEFELCKSGVAIDELLESSLYAFEEQAERDGKTLRCEIGNSAATVEMDLSVFKEIMNHLLSNAFKYTKKEATIIVRTSLRERNFIVEVVDNGCGVAEDCLPMLSQAFYQADGALNRQFEGAGLGLYVVSKFVELHDGVLEFESRPGQGFLARIEFPNAVCLVAESAAA